MCKINRDNRIQENYYKNFDRVNTYIVYLRHHCYIVRIIFTINI
jgi:hypothetical protein